MCNTDHIPLALRLRCTSHLLVGAIGIGLFCSPPLSAEPAAKKDALLVAVASLADIDGKVVAHVITIRLPFPEGLEWNKPGYQWLNEPDRANGNDRGIFSRNAARAMIDGKLFRSIGRQRVVLRDEHRKRLDEHESHFSWKPITHEDVSFTIPVDVTLADSKIEIFEDRPENGKDRRPSHVLRPTKQELKDTQQPLNGFVESITHDYLPSHRTTPAGIRFKLNYPLRVERVQLGEFKSAKIVPPVPTVVNGSRFVENKKQPTKVTFRYETLCPKSAKKDDKILIKLKGIDAWIQCDGPAE